MSFRRRFVERAPRSAHVAAGAGKAGDPSNAMRLIDRPTRSEASDNFVDRAACIGRFRSNPSLPTYFVSISRAAGPGTFSRFAGLAPDLLTGDAVMRSKVFLRQAVR